MSHEDTNLGCSFFARPAIRMAQIGDGMPKRDKNSVSLAGEFAVLSQLALQNFNASMTLGHTKGVDILISDPAKRMYRLEAKTTCQNSKKDATKSKDFGKFLDSWMMNKKHEDIDDRALFYCFVHIVDLEREKIFRFFILPCKIVAKYVKEEHQYWRKAKQKEGRRVKDTNMRLLRIGLEGEEYPVDTPLAKSCENNWEFA
jgi:hypothetical protein